jgi:hypothetical protein
MATCEPGTRRTAWRMRSSVAACAFAEGAEWCGACVRGVRIGRRVAAPTRPPAQTLTGWSPCEKFRRAMFMPDWMSSTSLSTSQHAGPIVQTICVRGWAREGGVGVEFTRRSSPTETDGASHAEPRSQFSAALYASPRGAQHFMPRLPVRAREARTFVLRLLASVGDKIFSSVMPLPRRDMLILDVRRVCDVCEARGRAGRNRPAAGERRLRRVRVGARPPCARARERRAARRTPLSRRHWHAHTHTQLQWSLPLSVAGSYCALPRCRVVGMATYMSPDAKKEEFRKYLDKAGVVDALTKGALHGRRARALSRPRLPRHRLPHTAPRATLQRSSVSTRSPSGRRTPSTT